MKIFWILILAVALGVSSCSIPSLDEINPADYPQHPFTVINEIQTELIEFMNTNDVTGLQVSLGNNTGFYHLNLGNEDRERRIPLQGDAALRIGSVSKLMTAIVIMNLVDRNHINLDDTVSRWFPELPGSDSISVRHLLNHTSGIGNYTTNLRNQFTLVTNPDKLWTFEEIYQVIVSYQPLFNPGEQHFYSNSNYILLGKIAELVTLRKFSRLLRQYLVIPLQLESTGIITAQHRGPTPITGYDIDLIPFGDYEIDPTNMSWPTYGWTAGAFVSSSSEMDRILRALFQGNLVSPKSLQQMRTFFPCTDEDIPVQTGYGLGMRRFDINGNTLIGHTGTILGFGAGTFYLPEQGIYLSFAANQSRLDQVGLIQKIVEILRKHEFQM